MAYSEDVPELVNFVALLEASSAHGLPLAWLVRHVRSASSLRCTGDQPGSGYRSTDGAAAGTRSLVVSAMSTVPSAVNATP